MLVKKMFWIISQFQRKKPAMEFFQVYNFIAKEHCLIRFLWLLRNFSKQMFCRTLVKACRSKPEWKRSYRNWKIRKYFYSIFYRYMYMALYKYMYIQVDTCIWLFTVTDFVVLVPIRIDSVSKTIGRHFVLSANSCKCGLAVVNPIQFWVL